MSKVRERPVVFVALLLIALCFPPASQLASASESMQLGVYVYENLEGYHTSSSTFGTRLGHELAGKFKRTQVSDNVPLVSNETVRILDELSKDQKIVVTSLSAAFKNGTVEYPSIVFADNDIKYTDLTWKVDTEKSLAEARAAGMTHALVGTCTGFATEPNPDSAAGKRGMWAVTASVNVRLHNLSTGDTDWMNTYRQVVAHTDPRLAFEQAAEEVAAQVAADLQKVVEEHSQE